MSHPSALRIIAALILLVKLATAFSFLSTFTSVHTSPIHFPKHHSLRVKSRTNKLLLAADSDAEVKKLLDQANKLRAEIAAMEGKSVDEVEAEAKASALADQEKNQKVIAEAAKYRSEQGKSSAMSLANGNFLVLPATASEQVEQAARAVERAFQDGQARQTVRLTLLKEDGSVGDSPEEWPGGAKQMYREAGCPLTKALLEEIRAPTGDAVDSPKAGYPPKIKAQDIWDFDGSGLVTAEAAAGPKGDVQALVFPNTDTKYLKDIEKISNAMGDRLFLIVNPFWRSVDSWGFNILAPNAKKLAQEIVFDQGYKETYVLNRLSVRGEDCAALKVYPYDWQLFAFIEDDYWPYTEKPLRLGSSKEEPNSSEFRDLLNERPEFKLSKNMRQLQRRSK